VTKQKPGYMPGFCLSRFFLLDRYLCATSGLASKSTGFDLLEANDAIFFGVNGKVTAHIRAWACLLGLTDLADDDFAGRDLLTAETLDAKPLSRTIVDVLA